MSESLTITDNRTGRTYEIPIVNGTIKAVDLQKLKLDGEDEGGLMSYDPAFLNTASCTSRITFIDGDKGILRYRGYPIEQLAEHSTFLEVAFLLLNGELPTRSELTEWESNVIERMWVHENVKKFIDGFHYDAHPMGILLSTVGAMSTFYPESRNLQDRESIRLSQLRLMAKMPTIAALAYRHSIGRPYVSPDSTLSYTGNFLNMMFRRDRPYVPPALFSRALDVLFILHADHEQNCSTNAVRTVGSSQVDPFSAVSAGVCALYGPLHGGANEAVIRMLKEIGSKDHVPDFIKRVKNHEAKLMGFGHRIYKSYDPRASLIKKLADEVFEVTGRNPLLDIAIELERIALEEDYFITRKLYPNVDFYSGLIYQALGFPTEMFPVLFALGRVPGWLSQWQEMLQDPEQKISRPRQVFLGADKRDYVPLESRGKKELASRA